MKAIQRVSVADVNRVARKYLDLDHAIVAILTPEPSGKPVSSPGPRGRGVLHPQTDQARQAARLGGKGPDSGFPYRLPR